MKFSFLTKNLFAHFIIEVFRVSFVLYLLLFIAEDFVSGFVSWYFNMNILLLLTIVSGIAAVLVAPAKRQKTMPPHGIQVRNIVSAAILGILGGGLLALKIHGLGIISVLLPISTGFAIMLLVFLLVLDDEKADQKE